MWKFVQDMMQQYTRSNRSNHLHRIILSLFAMLSVAACAVAPQQNSPELQKAYEQRLDKSLFDAAAEAERKLDYASATNFYKRLYDRNPKNLATVIGLSRSLRLSRRPAEGLGYVRRALQTFKRHPRLLAEMGKAQLVMGEPLKGVESLSRSDALEPNKWETIMAMGVGFDRVGLYDKAERQYRRALAVSPDNVIILNNLALSYAQSSKLEKAIELMERAANLPEAIPQIRQNLAMLYFMKGFDKKAERLIRRDLPPEIAVENIEAYKKMVQDGSIKDQLSGTKDNRTEVITQGGVRVRETTAQKPKLIPIEAKYIVTANTVIRKEGAPGTERMGELQAGNIVHVAARTLDRQWYLVETENKIQGYVFAPHLQKANNASLSQTTGSGTKLPKVLQADITKAPEQTSVAKISNVKSTDAKSSKDTTKSQTKQAAKKVAAKDQSTNLTPAKKVTKQTPQKSEVKTTQTPTQSTTKIETKKQKSAKVSDKKSSSNSGNTKNTTTEKTTPEQTTTARLTPAKENTTARVAAKNANGRIKDCEFCPELVRIPSGSFVMGSAPDERDRKDREGPQRTVKINKPIAVARFETTFRQWDMCVRDGGCPHKPNDNRWGRGDRPAINVSWHDVKQYIAWLKKKTGKSYRLLSEAEWEYVARAGTKSPYSTGDNISRKQAHYAAVNSKSRRTLPVGRFPANNFGLHDVHGGVREWTADCRNPDYKQAPADGRPWTSKGNCEYRVIRGGSWADRAPLLRSAYRSWTKAKNRSYIVGFRVARDL